jgi:hypothetical protein
MAGECLCLLKDCASDDERLCAAGETEAEEEIGKTKRGT